MSKDKYNFRFLTDEQVEELPGFVPDRSIKLSEKTIKLSELWATVMPHDQLNEFGIEEETQKAMNGLAMRPTICDKDKLTRLKATYDTEAYHRALKSGVQVPPL